MHTMMAMIMQCNLFLDDNPVYGTPVDVFSFAGIALHVFSEKWPAPTHPVK